MRQLTPICIAALILLQAPISFAESAAKPPVSGQQAIAQQLDTMAASFYKANEPGATVILVQDGKILLRKGYGMASVAEKRAMQPDDVLRLGSITKQFTAVGILLLLEEGKISLTDNLQKFFPDYPESGKKVTVEHLLTHTSGIPSYTGKADFKAKLGMDISVSQMIASFKNDPLEFEPGSSYRYNNSGYFLLGAIIEKVSGESYAKFVEKRLFVPLNMQNTAYESYERSKQAHAAGHSAGKDGYGPSEKISMTLPYAAGALVSTVDDLALWDAAISAGKLLKAENWQRAFTSYSLSNGQATNYGYGWNLGKLEGSAMIAHGGGIHGFSTYALRLPQEKIYVAVLSNADGGLAAPGMVASRLAAAAMGKPIPEFKAISLDSKALDQFSGVYRIDDHNRRNIVREGDRLIMSRTNGPRTSLQAYSENGFFQDSKSLLRVEFSKNAKGEVTDLIVHQNGTSTSHARTNEALPKAAATMQIPAALFDTYVGKYQLAPNFILTISRDGERYLSQATGQDIVEISAISESVFLAKSIPAELRFEKSKDGSVSQLVLTQGGREMPAKKLQ